MLRENLPHEPKAHEPKKRLIAVNILPQHISAGNALQLLKENIEFARAANFMHAWINPITLTPKDTICSRIDLDTGIHTTLRGSLYAPDDPRIIRRDFSMTAVREILRDAKAKNFHVLVDFVWKHVSNQSSLKKKFAHKKWFKGHVFNDITEYNFQFDKTGAPTDPTKEVLDLLIETIDLYLNDNTGYGFSGLRVDAASHIMPEVRHYLFSYIRNKYPAAIILEEFLFDGNVDVLSLVQAADSKKDYSDFITTNLYYQKQDEFGAIPLPCDMNDEAKTRLAAGNGIGFTGNHDHYSAGWSIILAMAAQKLFENKTEMDALFGVSCSVFTSDSPGKSNLETIQSLSTGALLPENMNAKQQICVRYLLPYANQIARALLNTADENHNKLFEEFRRKLFISIANRSLPSMSGYFMLFSELISPFETQRIFSNNHEARLSYFFITADDLMRDMNATIKVIKCILANNYTYDNASNFIKNTKSINELVNKNKTNVKININELRLWLPFIMDYLRNHPTEAASFGMYKEHGNHSPASKIAWLQDELGTVAFIKSINTIFAELTTLTCNDYYTFATEDTKIVIRFAADTTDIIILSLKLDRITIDHIELEKIAIILQARKFPIPKKGTKLAEPFDSNESVIYPPDGYVDYWKTINDGEHATAFDDCYMRIMGQKSDHITYIYLGNGINCELKLTDRLRLRVHDRTRQQIEDDLFHEQVVVVSQPTPSSFRLFDHSANCPDQPQTNRTNNMQDNHKY